MQKNEIFKNIPSVQDILQSYELSNLYKKYKTEIIKKIINKNLDEIKIQIKSSDYFDNYTKQDFFKDIISKLENEFENLENRFVKVINASGIIIHTNLGRSPVSKNILNISSNLASSYMNLEYDLSNSSRLDRNTPIKDLFKLIANFEDTIVVNNNASSLLLIFDSFAKDKNAIISRGELIEIGDGFRILDIINCTDTLIKEVGSTNRTYIKDYENAIDSNTSLILKVNKSNYHIEGYTEDVCSKNLSTLCKDKNIILVEDLGSGNLINFKNSHINQRNIFDIIDDDIDMVCFSADKMLGSSQAGIIAGKAKYIQKLRKNPMFRALRAGKLSIINLYESLKLYIQNDFINQIPVLDMIFSDEKLLYEKASKLYDLIEKNKLSYVKIQKSTAYIGGGVSSKSELNSFCVELKSKYIGTSKIEKLLRTKSKYPIISKIKNDNLIFDVICLSNDDISFISQNLNFILSKY